MLETTDLQMFPSAAATTWKSAGCPSPTEGCLRATGPHPTWLQPSTVVRTSFPVNLIVTQKQIRRRFSARTPTHDPTFSTDKHTVIACDGQEARLKCGKNVCFTFTIITHPWQKDGFWSPVCSSLRQGRYSHHQVQLRASGQEHLHQNAVQHDLLYQ